MGETKSGAEGPAGVSIRPTMEADFPAIAELTNVFITTSAVHFAYEPVTTAEMREQWEQTREKYPWLTAECEGRFAGYAKASMWRSRTAYSWTAEAGIYMHADFRGRGMGRALYAALIEELRRRGFRSVIGGIALPNEASVKLHESLGFVSVGVVREAGYKMGRWHDVGFWQRVLGGGQMVK